jgi:cyclopropane fatty-acyl-phospholipid synthase-like methyltransferase
MDYYKKNSQDLIRCYESADVKEMQAFLLSSFDRGAKLLEIGCGSGRDAAFMLAQGYDITGVDGASEMIASALKIHPELSGRLFTVHLPQGLSQFSAPFDGIFSIATLMHLTRPAIEEVFKRVGLLIHQHGRFFFSVPCRRNDVDKDGFDEKGRRFTALSAHDWVLICQNSGFEVISSQTTDDGLGREGIVWLNCLVKRIRNIGSIGRT